MYKYSLDKSSKKFSCPRCHEKSFVFYVDNQTRNYLNPSIGRCDKESKCGYHAKPNGNTTLVGINKLEVKIEPTCHHPDTLKVFANKYTENNFVKFLLQHFCKQDVKNAIKKYFISTSAHWQGATIFWQVDQQLNIMAGKVMLYDAISGKRVKEPYPHVNWMHKVIPVHNFVLQQCLFGIHNLCDYANSATICIVESEKTAIIMSIIFPSYLWLATGSKSNLKFDLLKPLKNYKIIVYADKSEYSDWSERVNRIQRKGFDIICSQFLEELPIKDGEDLVDLLF